MEYRRVGSSGMRLPAVSLGLWHNFGEDRSPDTQRAIVRRAFDLGVTHFDLANNYGPPPGEAERRFGQILDGDLRGHRDELVVATKAGYDMWAGPYGSGCSRKHLRASLDQSLARLGVDYVDIFYAHRYDPDTPLEETLGALRDAVAQGKALHVGVSSYSSEQTRRTAAMLRAAGTPLLIHQPSYSMFDRWIDGDGLLDTLETESAGCIAFSPLSQGLLSARYLDSVPEDSRANEGSSLTRDALHPIVLDKVRALDELARRRGQSLAQMAIAWVLRDPRMTSALVGVSRVSQLEDNLGALAAPPFSDEELAEIEDRATFR